MAQLAFTVPGAPRGKGRPRATTRGGVARLYTDAKTASYENLVALAAETALAGSVPMMGPLSMHVRVRMAPPACTPKRRVALMLTGAEMPAKKPDLDNCLKAVMDGCNGVAFVDDALIVHLTATKIYAALPGVDVLIEPYALEGAVAA